MVISARLKSALAVAALAILAALALLTYRWAVSPTLLRVGIAADAVHLREVMVLWSSHLDRSRGGYRLKLQEFATQAEALEALAAKRLDAGAIRVDQETPSELRALAILRRQFLVRQAAASGEPSPDVAYVSSRVGGAPGAPALGLLDAADWRSARAPKDLLRLEQIANAAEPDPRLWFIGALMDQGEGDEANWRKTALSLTHQLVTTDDVDRQLVHDLVRSLQDAVRSTRAAHRAMRSVTLAPIEDGAALLRAHDGVARYVNREGEGFMERYGDWVYVGMSVVGVVATGLGALFAALAYRMRDNGRRHLSRMEVVLDQAQSAASRAERDRVMAVANKLTLQFAKDVARHRVSERNASAFALLQAAVQAQLGHAPSPQRDRVEG